MTKINNWLVAFRVRTLPLSLAPVITGTGLAYKDSFINPVVFTFTLLTTLFLQILSNLANDYGDFIKGIDNNMRVGEKRALQSGMISKQEMKKSVVFFSILSFISGMLLLFFSIDVIHLRGLIIMLCIGIACIAAAITYTIGKKSYGYMGLGDLFVILFFGIIGVYGSYFLQTGKLTYSVLLPAFSIGLFSAAVLNINNLRDYNNDKAHGKKTLVVIMGVKKAKNYHALILTLGMLAMIAFSYMQAPKQGELVQFIYLVTFPIFIMNIIDVFETYKPQKLDTKLKPLALAILMCALLFATGLMLAYYK